MSAPRKEGNDPPPATKKGNSENPQVPTSGVAQAPSSGATGIHGPAIGVTQAQSTGVPQAPSTGVTQLTAQQTPASAVPQALATGTPKSPATVAPKAPATRTQGPATGAPQGPITGAPQSPVTKTPQGPATVAPKGTAIRTSQGTAAREPHGPATGAPQTQFTRKPQGPAAGEPQPQGPATIASKGPATKTPQGPAAGEPQGPATVAPIGPATRTQQGPAAGEPQCPATRTPQGPAAGEAQGPATVAPQTATGTPETPTGTPQTPTTNTTNTPGEMKPKAEGDSKSKRLSPELEMIQKLVHEHKITGEHGMQYTKAQLRTVFDTVKPIFKKERMLMRVKAPIKIVGDIHGQYLDLKRHFRANGWPPKVNYLFLGDYIDRGCYSLETIVLLFGYKCLYKGKMILLRGNHECMNVNKVYGFFDELNRRGFGDLYQEINDIFNWMPISALINSKILCMHGGISQSIQTLDDIANIPRPLTMRPPRSKVNPVAMDLLWADPVEGINGYQKSKRGVSQEFGLDVLDEFCRKLHLQMVVRGHEVKQLGFERLGLFANRTRIVTVFSAPNYCNEFDNVGAVMVVEANLYSKFVTLSPEDMYQIETRNRKLTPKFDVMPPELPPK